MGKIKMWEILIPVYSNSGKRFKKSDHQKWMQKLQSYTDGLTIHGVVDGIWVEPRSKKHVKEQIIPIRIACKQETIYDIIDLTIDHYNQDAVMCYQVSDNVIVMSRLVEQSDQQIEPVFEDGKKVYAYVTNIGL